MLCNHKGLAKTSGKPGKTQLINHFGINQSWYLVDLPGYGYAKVSKKDRSKFQFIITSYLKNRESLMNTFVLLDSRLEPQAIDLDFMEWMGKNRLPFAMVFTKADKLKPAALEANIKLYKETMLEAWAELPPLFITSAEDKRGKEELLDYVDHTNQFFNK
jgi:GTP-binding protein